METTIDRGPKREVATAHDRRAATPERQHDIIAAALDRNRDKQVQLARKLRNGVADPVAVQAELNDLKASASALTGWMGA